MKHVNKTNAHVSFSSLMSDYHGAGYKSSRQLQEPRHLPLQWCNGNGRCKKCSCVKAGRPCTNCLPSRNGTCENSGPALTTPVASPVVSKTVAPDLITLSRTGSQPCKWGEGEDGDEVGPNGKERCVRPEDGDDDGAGGADGGGGVGSGHGGGGNGDSDDVDDVDGSGDGEEGAGGGDGGVGGNGVAVEVVVDVVVTMGTNGCGNHTMEAESNQHSSLHVLIYTLAT